MAYQVVASFQFRRDLAELGLYLHEEFSPRVREKVLSKLRSRIFTPASFPDQGRSLGTFYRILSEFSHIRGERNTIICQADHANQTFILLCLHGNRQDITERLLKDFSPPD